MENKSKVVVGIEIGGTNIKVAIAPVNEDVNKIADLLTSGKIQVKEMKTKKPSDTVKEISEWVLKENKLDSSYIEKVYISNFGPIELNKKSKDYGLILNTPKPGWKDFNVIKSFAEHFNLSPDQVKVDLDVSCAAFLEHKLGNHNVESLVYITIGTGVGAGIVINGKVLEGIHNPNVGHITVTRHSKDTYAGNCPIHKDCLEGLISNGAIKERKNLDDVDKCTEISDDDEIWDFIAYYIGQLCISLLYILSTEKIVIGGGIINRQSLLDKIREHFIKVNNNYVDHPSFKKENIHNFITRTDFKNYAGIISAFNLNNA